MARIVSAVLLAAWFYRRTVDAKRGKLDYENMDVSQETVSTNMWRRSFSAASGVWAYDDEVVSEELANLRGKPPFNYATLTWWEDAADQEVHSNANSDIKDGDISNYAGPSLYKYESYKKKDDPSADLLPYSDIIDNTESISAFADVLGFVPEGSFLVDLGAGKFNSTKRWVQQQRPDITMLVADPFNRAQEENVKVQMETENRGGADVVTSMSVLNVVADLKHQTFHVWLVYNALKRGGLAIFKAWAGIWPLRGTRKQEVDEALNGEEIRMAQNNAFAEAYKPLIEKVFGEGNVYADSVMNMLVARKVG